MTEGLIWSIALAAVGILGLYLAGRKNVWGWAIGVGAQVLWIAYAIVTQQYGFILSALAYGWVYSLNWWRWRREERERKSWEPLERKWREHRQAMKPPTVGPKGGAGDSGASRT